MPLRIIPADELPKLTSYAECRKPPIALCWHLMLQAGLRVGEVCSLSWCDVIHENQPKTAIFLDKDCTKNNRTRTVPVNRRLHDSIFHHWVDWAHPAGFAPAHILTARTPNGRGYTTRSLQRHIQQIGTHEGFPRLTPHMLRHTFATRLLKVSNIRAVQEALGHRRVTTTQVYTHVNADDLAEAIAKTDDPR